MSTRHQHVFRYHTLYMELMHFRQYLQYLDCMVSKRFALRLRRFLQDKVGNLCQDWNRGRQTLGRIVDS